MKSVLLSLSLAVIFIQGIDAKELVLSANSKKLSMDLRKHKRATYSITEPYFCFMSVKNDQKQDPNARYYSNLIYEVSVSFLKGKDFTKFVERQTGMYEKGSSGRIVDTKILKNGDAFTEIKEHSLKDVSTLRFIYYKKLLNEIIIIDLSNSDLLMKVGSRSKKEARDLVSDFLMSVRLDGKKFIKMDKIMKRVKL